VADLNAVVELVQKLRFIPLDFPAVVQVVVAAGAPLIAVVLTLVPVHELVTWIVGSIA